VKLTYSKSGRETEWQWLCAIERADGFMVVCPGHDKFEARVRALLTMRREYQQNEKYKGAGVLIVA
jgi:hypothetical protein